MVAALVIISVFHSREVIGCRALRRTLGTRGPDRFGCFMLPEWLGSFTLPIEASLHVATRHRRIELLLYDWRIRRSIRSRPE